MTQLQNAETLNVKTNTFRTDNETVRHRRSPRSCKLSMLVATALLIAASSNAGQQAATELTTDDPLGNAPPISAQHHGRVPLLTVTAPTSREKLATPSVSIDLAIARRANDQSLIVTLNGHRITKDFHRGKSCTSTCTESASVTAAEGLRKGGNVLRASIAGRDGRRDVKWVWFLWKKEGGVGSSDVPPFELTASIGFTTVAPGGQANGAPWFQLYSNALHGGVANYPAVTDTTCTTNYQVLDIDRQTLAEKSYACYDSDSELSAALAQFAPSDPSAGMPDLVVAGTTLNHNALSALNTTAIGGTNYSKSALPLPQGYMVIGVGGATSGATESYYLSSWLGDDQDPNSYLPQLNGSLIIASGGYYTYHPADNTLYSVVNTAGTDAGPFQIRITGPYGNDLYEPPSGSADGFWLLRLKRTRLGNTHACNTNVSPTPCGEFYPTGNSDPPTALQAVSDLAAALSGASSEELLFLVSIGTPLGAPTTTALGNAIENLGGAIQTFTTILNNNNTYNYTLISSNDPSFVKTFPGGSVVVSSNVNKNQGQSGSVYGVLSRDLHNLMIPVSTNQGNVITDTKVSDESLYQIAWNQPAAWPLMDTSGHLGAYRYLSYMVTLSALGSGAATDDIRSQYAGSNNGDIVSKGNPLGVPFPSGGTWTDPVAGPDQGTVFTFLTSDMNAVASQLNAEINDLLHVGIYMNGDQNNVGLRPALVASGTGTVFSLINAAASAATALSAPTTTTTHLNAAATTNVLRAYMALLTVANPEIAPVTGVANAALWISTAADPLVKGSQAIPSPYNDLVNTVAELSETSFQTGYASATGGGFDDMVDNIYSDWTKLDTVAAKVVTTWAIPYQTAWDDVTTSVTQASSVRFYTEIFASIYSMDTFPGQPVQQPWKIGSTIVENQPCRVICEHSCKALYHSSLPANGWVAHPTIGSSTLTDLLIVGGPLQKNNTNSMTEKLPTSTELNTLFGTDLSSGDLNLFTDQFFATNGIVPRRAGSAAPGFEGPLCYPNASRAR